MNLVELHKIKELYMHREIPIVLHGTGMIGESVARILKALHFNILYFVDNAKYRIGQDVLGIRVESIERLKQEPLFHLIITAGISYYDQIYKEYVKLGYEKHLVQMQTYLTVWNFEDSIQAITYINSVSDGQCEQYEQRFQEEYGTYQAINLYYLDSTRIGETCTRVVNIIDDEYKPLSNDSVHAVFFSNTQVCNWELMKLVQQRVHLITQIEEFAFWEYVLSKHGDVVSINHFDEYHASKMKLYQCTVGEHILEFSKEEKQEAERELQEIKIKRPFVCVQNRDSGYLENYMPDDNHTMHNYRDYGIESFRLATEYLHKQNILSVRMGKNNKDVSQDKNIYDYAALNRTEKMDLYLLEQANFFLGGTAGLCVAASLLGTPKVLTNMIPLHVWHQSIPTSNKDLFIPKKGWLISEKRFLSFKEMCLCNRMPINIAMLYKKLGVEIINNTAEEILDVTEEMNLSLENQYEYQEEDQYLQNLFQEYRRDICRTQGTPIMGACHAKMGAKYLRENHKILFREEELR